MEKRELTETDIELLARYGLKDLDPRAAVGLTFEQQEYMLREGGPIDYLYIVVSGKAKVCLSVSSGKQLLLSYFMSTGIVGEAELMTDSREAYSAVQAVSRLTCIGPSAACLRRCAEKQPRIRQLCRQGTGEETGAVQHERRDYDSSAARGPSMCLYPADGGRRRVPRKAHGSRRARRDKLPPSDAKHRQALQRRNPLEGAFRSAHRGPACPEQKGRGFIHNGADGALSSVRGSKQIITYRRGER